VILSGYLSLNFVIEAIKNDEQPHSSRFFKGNEANQSLTLNSNSMYKVAIILSITFLGAGLAKKETQIKSPLNTITSIQQPKELGKVKWLRDIKTATAKSSNENKPIFLLFQEVPGCSTCRNYGQNVLSHPLIVEAIETYFIPLAIHNNKGGKDKEVLDYFGEPSWNNPVVRIVDHKKKNLVNRISGNYSVLGLTEAMIEVLNSKKQAIPTYLNLLQEELTAKEGGIQTAYVSMYCFWSGEKKLADIDGVVETQAGFMGGREVVKVDFSSEIISYEDLLGQAKTKSCASHVYSDNLFQQLAAEKVVGTDYVSEKTNFRMDKETKYYLYKSSYKYLPMTKLQAIKANSLIGKGQSPNEVFSPRQLALLKRIQKNPSKKWKSAINVDVIEAWNKVEKV